MEADRGMRRRGSAPGVNVCGACARGGGRRPWHPSVLLKTTLTEALARCTSVQ